MAQFIADADPYDHLLVVHTYPNEQEQVYRPLLGEPVGAHRRLAAEQWNVTHERTTSG